MLTNLNWLNAGQTFPPPTESKRLEKYRTNSMLFDNMQSTVWQEDYALLARKLGKTDIDVRTVLNYHKLLSVKIADFVCSEPPTIETEQDTDKLLRLLERDDWCGKLYEAVIDISRYGNAVFKFVGKSLSTVSPQFWFPVVDECDLKRITQHVIAYPVCPNDKGVFTQLYVEIHSVGAVETRRYMLDKGTVLGSEITDERKTERTALKAFAVQPLTNVTHSGDIYGIDDYGAINSIVCDIIWRLYCIDRVLDKHSEPTLSGPQSALSYDENKKSYKILMGKFFTRNTAEEPDIKYITWDGNLDAAFKELEQLFQQLYIISEMGQAFAIGKDGGGESSGTALKIRLVSPRVKAARIANLNMSCVKRIIALFAELNSIKIDYDTLVLHFNDGLPIDENEQIQTLSTATGGKAVMSQYAALKRMGRTDAQVEEELEQIADEAAAASPVVLTSVDKAGEADDGE